MFRPVWISVVGHSQLTDGSRMCYPIWNETHGIAKRGNNVCSDWWFTGRAGHRCTCRLTWTWPTGNLESKTHTWTCQNTCQQVPMTCRSQVPTGIPVKQVLKLPVTGIENTCRYTCRYLQNLVEHYLENYIHPLLLSLGVRPCEQLNVGLSPSVSDYRNLITRMP